MKLRRLGMRYVVCALFTLAATPLMAGSSTIPRYDSEGYCRQVERRTGLQANSIVPSCIASEQESLEALRVLWTRVTDPVRGFCERRVRAIITGS
jgi:hypothetical protein